MALEPWISYIPEVNYYRMEGNSTGANNMSRRFFVLADNFNTQAEEQLKNARKIAEYAPGETSSALINQAIRDQKEANATSTSAKTSAAMAQSAALHTDLARLQRTPINDIKINRVIRKVAVDQVFWNPLAGPTVVTCDMVYGCMRLHNALVGSKMDSAVVRGSNRAATFKPHVMDTSGMYNKGGIFDTLLGGSDSTGVGRKGTASGYGGHDETVRGNWNKSDVHSSLNHGLGTNNSYSDLFDRRPTPGDIAASPNVQYHINDQANSARQFAEMHNGMRGGGLGGGDTLPAVGATPQTMGTHVTRGGIPRLGTTLSPNGTPRLNSLPRLSYSPNASGNGINFRASVPGTLGGQSGTYTLRGGMHGTLGGRVGPGFTGINPADKMLTNTVGKLAPATVGAPTGTGTGASGAAPSTVAGRGGGMGMTPGMARNMQQRDEQGRLAYGYIAKEVEINIEKPDPELERRRKEMFD